MPPGKQGKWCKVIPDREKKLLARLEQLSFDSVPLAGKSKMIIIKPSCREEICTKENEKR